MERNTKIKANKEYFLPNPIVNSKEISSLDDLTKRYNKLVEPNAIVKIGQKAGEKVPEKIKEFGTDVTNSISSKELYKQAMELVAKGFNVVEEQAAKYSISEETIIKKVNRSISDYEVAEINEICFARSYELSKLVNSNKSKDRLSAFIEGGTTGVAGFWGLPFNLVLSTFLYFRAVQTIAMFYGYDVKNDSTEMIISSEVFANALSPAKSVINNELTNTISKIMVMSQAAAVKQASKKTWTDMISKGGVPLLITQMRALANKAAQKALQNAGTKGLENSVFREVFEQIGRKLTLKTVQKAVPFVSAGLGALIDTAQMNSVLEYADIFYQKRFILEKKERIMRIVEGEGFENDTTIVENSVSDGADI